MQRFVVRRGDSTVGSRPENIFAFPVPGVSRHHALFHLADEGLIVRDLGSKNGTIVNGKQIEERQLGAGDVLSLGGLSITVEGIDSSDAALAIERGHSRSGVHAAIDRSGSAEAHPRRRNDEPPRWVELVARLSRELLRVGSSGLGPVLDDLHRELEAEGACLASWKANGEPALIDATGTPEGLLEALRKVQGWAGVAVSPEEPGQVSTGFIDSEMGPLAVSASLPGVARGPQALVVWGDFPHRAASLPLVEIVLRMILHSEAEHVSHDLAAAPPRAVELVFPDGHLVGHSQAMRTVYEQVGNLVQGDIPVLITGETGVGKEHVAQIIHLSSDRARGPFQVVHCAAIPAELLEAELFGIEKGVATGVSARVGKFALAQGGVVFLDEVGDMPPGLQAKILRVLQTHQVVPVGSGEPVGVNVRVIAATNCDLDQLVEEGRFRRDLYFRIAGFTLRVPPLVERRHDIPALAEFFLRRSAQEVGKSLPGISVRALRLLTEAAWPGNVRQLEHEVRRLVYLARRGEPVDSTHISAHVLAPAPPGASSGIAHDDDLTLEKHVERLERRLITIALKRTDGNQSAAARLLGITRNGLASKMERLGIEA